MANNLVEYHIQDGAIFTFKVKAGQTVKIGQMVELTGDREVQVAGASSTKAVGVVYGGTVGKDGINTGFLGDEGDVVSVVCLKPLVYLKASGAITAGANLVTAAGGDVKVAGAVGTETGKFVGMAIQAATTGNRFVAILY